MDLLTLVRQLERTQWERHVALVPQKPILTRRALQDLRLPKDHYEARSSGSTGIPVTVQKSRLSLTWLIATNIREAQWFKRDVSLSMAVIRATFKKPDSQRGWGPGFDEVFGRSGALHVHPVHGDLNGWLRKVNPHYLFTLPSVLETLDLSALPRLKGIRTTGETLLRRHPLVADTYSTEEVGTVAIQCPDNEEVYHVQENLVVEILDENDQSARRGRVIVTDLTSLYLHRYDIGDYAEVGHCDCGRGLQTLRRVLGRRRNMVVLPDGSRRWPTVGSYEYRSIAPTVRRYQVAQVSRTALELRLVTDGPLTKEQEGGLVAVVQKWIGHPFDVKIVLVPEFPSGKFEEFVSLVEDAREAGRSLR